MVRSYYPNFKISKCSSVCSKNFAEIDSIKTTRSESFSLHKNVVLLWFDDEKYEHVFNDNLSKLLWYYMLYSFMLAIYL